MHPSSRQRPAGLAGPTRDAARDALITDAALTLLAEGGYEALTMEKTAALAGVGKATVYRRWASRADLASDALETIGFAVPKAGAGPDLPLRDDLIHTLIEVTGCLAPDRHRLISAVLAAAARHPDLALSLRARFTAAVDQAVAAAVGRARHRGIFVPGATNPMLATTVVALLAHLPDRPNRTLDAADFETITDHVLLPLLGPHL